MDKVLQFLNKLDWVLAAATVVAGIYLQNWWLVSGGLIGFIVAWYKPAEKLQAKVKQRILRKKAANAPVDANLGEAIYQEMASSAVSPIEAPPPRTYRDGYPPLNIRVSSSKHNRLRAEHFNLAEAPLSYQNSMRWY